MVETSGTTINVVVGGDGPPVLLLHGYPQTHVEWRKIMSEEVKRRIVADGGDPIASSPEEYAANIEREEGKWEALIKKLGLKVE